MPARSSRQPANLSDKGFWSAWSLKKTRAQKGESVYERTRIENISEHDFWSAWRTDDPALKKAVALAKAGRKDAAYRALAEYHRESLAAEYAFERKQAEQRNTTPEARRSTESRAADVLRGKIAGWSSIALSFGKHIDFHDTRFGKSGIYGFHYLGWLVPLSDRFYLDGNPADLARVIDIARQYYDQRLGVPRPHPQWNPVYYELGAWAKTVHLLPAYLALINEGKPSGRDIEAFLKLFLGFGRSLFILEKDGFRPGNWQIVGSSALFRLGALFTELREAPAWRKRALATMESHLDQDFFADGGHKERCWGYGWMSLRDVIVLYETGRRTGFLSPAKQARFLRAIRQAFRWYLQTVGPTGVFPAYGDSDLIRMDDLLAAAARYMPAEHDPALDRRASVCLKPSGYAIMRDDASRDSRYLNINFGPWGGGHTHQDLLDFNAWAFGEPLIEEVGRFDSYDHPFNPFFYSPEAHNQIVIDRMPMLRHESTGQDVVWKSTPQFDYFSAWHDAFTPPSFPLSAYPRRGGPLAPRLARIHRHILFKRGEYWLFYDFVEPARDTIFTVSSWLHSVRPFKVLGPSRAIVTGRVGALVAFAHTGEIKRLETGTDIALPEVTVKRLYPERHFLHATTWAPNGYAGCIRFAMLLYPFKGRPPAVSIRPLPMKSEAPGIAEAFEIITPRGRDRIIFNRAKTPSLSFRRA